MAGGQGDLLHCLHMYVFKCPIMPLSSAAAMQRIPVHYAVSVFEAYGPIHQRQDTGESDDLILAQYVTFLGINTHWSHFVFCRFRPVCDKLRNET